MPKSVKRIFKILHYIKWEWHTVSEISKEIDINTITIHTDIKELEELGMIRWRLRETKNRGKKPIEYKIKRSVESEFSMRFQIIPVLLVLDVLSDYKKKGLTAKELSIEIDMGVAKTYRLLKALLAMKWIYIKNKRLTQQGKRENVYAPVYEIVEIPYRERYND